MDNTASTIAEIIRKHEANNPFIVRLDLARSFDRLADEYTKRGDNKNAFESQLCAETIARNLGHRAMAAYYSAKAAGYSDNPKHIAMLLDLAVMNYEKSNLPYVEKEKNVMYASLRAAEAYGRIFNSRDALKEAYGLIRDAEAIAKNERMHGDPMYCLLHKGVSYVRKRIREAKNAEWKERREDKKQQIEIRNPRIQKMAKKVIVEYKFPHITNRNSQNL